MWDCEAYGPDGPEAGRLCFYADAGFRNCGSRAECAASVAGARELLFDLMRKKAGEGDPVAVQLSERFTSPGQTLRWPVTLGGLPYVVDEDAEYVRQHGGDDLDAGHTRDPEGDEAAHG
jgi:hypothetical protein